MKIFNKINIDEKLITFLIIALIGYFAIFSLNEDQYQRIKEIINIIVWPIIIFISILYFNKIFTYLFFSMNKFNFFGIEGELKDIEKVIDEQANKKIEEKEIEEKIKSLAITTKEKENLESLYKFLNEKLEIKNKEAEESTKIAERSLSLCETMLEELKKSNKKPEA
jgi:hypothetical protein